MANDINRVTLIGRLVRDVELAYTAGGMPIGKGSIAVNRRKSTKDAPVDEVSYFEIVIYGKLAENLKPYLTKGKQVAVDGYLKQERWQSQDGKNSQKIIVGVNEIELIGGNGNGNSSPNTSSYQVAQPEPSGYGYTQSDLTF